MKTAGRGPAAFVAAPYCYAAFLLTRAVAILVSFSSVVFSSSRFFWSTLAQSGRQVGAALADAGANIARHDTLTLMLSRLSCAALA